MNFFVAIIIFCVSVIWFALASLIRLPHLKVGVYSFRKPWLERFWMMRVWPLVLILATICWTVIIILYIIYVIIRTFVPWPFKKPLLRAQPFRAMRESGLIRLLDSIFGIIFSRASFLNRFKRAGYAAGTFFTGYTLYIFGMMGYNKKNLKSWLAADDPSCPAPSVPSREERLSRIKEKDKQVPFEPSENRKLDDQYIQCVEENTAHITPDMTTNDRRLMEQKNSAARAMCRLQQMQSQMNSVLGIH